MPEELKPCEHDWGIYQALHDFNAPDNSFCEYVCFKCQEKKMVKPRPAEKLVPLDKVKIYHLIKKYFLMIPGDDRPTNILQYTSLDDACDEICARFASVPVVPDMVWPDTIKPSLSGDGSYVNGYMDAIEACKAAHAKALEQAKRGGS